MTHEETEKTLDIDQSQIDSTEVNTEPKPISDISDNVAEGAEKIRYQALFEKVIEQFGKVVPSNELAKFGPISPEYPITFNGAHYYGVVDENGRVVSFNTGMFGDDEILRFLGGAETEEGKLFAGLNSSRTPSDGIIYFFALIDAIGAVRHTGASDSEHLNKFPGVEALYDARFEVLTSVQDN